MKSPGNHAEFEKQLIANGINVVFRQNDAGRIYGVTFIDHSNKCVLNGSRLGKEFSANVFNELFTWSKENHNSQQHTYNNIVHTDKPDFKSQYDTDNSDESLNLFSIETNGGTDSEEEAFIRRMRKKKKRKNPI